MLVHSLKGLVCDLHSGKEKDVVLAQQLRDYILTLRQQAAERYWVRYELLKLKSTSDLILPPIPPHLFQQCHFPNSS